MNRKLILGFLIVSVTLMSCSLFNRAISNPSSSTAAGGSIAEFVASQPAEVTNVKVTAAEMDLRKAVREQIRSELGADADAVFQQMDAAFGAMADKLYNDASDPSRFGLQQGATLIGVMTVVALIPKLASDMKDGTKTETVPPLFDKAKGDGKLSLTKNGSKIHGEIEVPLSMQTEKGMYTETAKGKIDMDLCPDAGGGVDLKLSLSFNVGISGGEGAGSGSASISLTIDGSVTGKVNDEANLASADYHYKVGNAKTGQGSAASKITNSFVEIDHSFSITYGRNGEKNTATNERSEVIRNSSKATGKDAADASKTGSVLMGLVTSMVLGMAEVIWQDGFCVEILIDGAQEVNSIAPSARDDFTARVKHKWEGIELEAGIDAGLKGEKSINPEDKKSAPVNYVYTAGDKDKQEAVVTLETRSKRGAAKKTLTFKTETGAYSVKGEMGEMTLTGQICGTGSPFTLKAVPLDVPLEFTFDFIPGSDTSGTIAISGGGALEGGKMTMSGGGTYQFEGLDGDNPQLTGDVAAVVVSSGAGRTVNTNHDDSFRFTLTKLDASSCAP
ncbi:MAG TPA: hypothetical protein PJ988_14605 [Anaerolinea sp.]|nr:hypothetical protein [Anaerolinea sp.]